MIYFLLLPLSLIATETFFSSDQVSYTDQNLSLEGHVSINHPLGIVTADQAEISELTESSFLTAILKSNVEFFFKEDRLTAQEVILNNATNQVLAKGPTTLSGTKDNFSLMCDGSAQFEKASMCLTFCSNFLPVSFSKGETLIESKSAFLTFENNEPATLVFKEDVHLTNGSIKGVADHLVYNLKEGSLQGLGKVSFVLQRDETDKLLELWKKKSS